MTDRTDVETRDRYGWFFPIQTRWSDNDIYGHINNVVYYSYFDTVISRFLIDEGGFDFINGRIIGIAVENKFEFKQSIMHPDKIEGGLRIAKIGTSSVRYEIGIFKEGENEAVAFGHFVHVFVDRDSNRPQPIPEAIRTAMQGILREP
ncbi:MAG: acyl-CoA thioesterase [Rhodospirillales bacterium]|nr:acyl-CoA thioesterase [Rhodospirillales bacterium]